MGNALTVEDDDDRIVVTEASLLQEYKNTTLEEIQSAIDNYEELKNQDGDRTAIDADEFDEIFSLICQDPSEHFKLFDSLGANKVDALEVLAVLTVYCKASMREKIPFMFRLFDFDKSHDMSRDEVVMLMLCTTRGLCKVVGKERPPKAELEVLARQAFRQMDADASGLISLTEFTNWAIDEPSIIHYLTRFANTKLIFDHQQKYDKKMKVICEAFMSRASYTGGGGGGGGSSSSSSARFPPGSDRAPVFAREYVCTADSIRELLYTHFPTSSVQDLQFVLDTIVQLTIDAQQSYYTHARSSSRHALPLGDHGGGMVWVPIEYFCNVVSPFVVFLICDEDEQHTIDMKELKYLIWLLKGKEPNGLLVENFMRSLDSDQNGQLSCNEWIAYAIQHDARTNGALLTIGHRMQMMFVTADTNEDALLSRTELHDAVREAVISLVRKGMSDKAWEKILLTKGPVIQELTVNLANELMQVMDVNDSHQIEWYEFRQHLGVVEERLQQMKEYICDVVIKQ